MKGPPRRSDQRRSVLAFFALTRACRSHTLARGLVRIARQPADHIEELWLLADEQSVIFEGFDSRYRAGVFYRGRANDRNCRELSVEERAGLGHDQIGLEVLPAEGRYIEVRKHELGIGRIRQRSQRVRNRVARLVVPGLEVRGLGRANTEQDSQDLWMADAQGQCRVEAAATYLDKGEMECAVLAIAWMCLPVLSIVMSLSSRGIAGNCP